MTILMRPQLRLVARLSLNSLVPRVVYNPAEEVPKAYRVTEVPKGNIPADEPL